jgi:protein-tyrosine phosphatase
MIDAKTILKLMLPRGARRDYPTAESLIIEPEEDVRVTREADQSLRFVWTRQADRIEIFGGTTCDSIDLSHLLLSVEGKTEVLVSGLDPAVRYYFEVVFHEGTTITRRRTAERVLPLQHGVNFRDIGGYRTADGKSVKWGLAYRSGGLNELSDDDLGYLNRIGVRMVCDLRTDREIAEEPDRRPDGVQYQKHSILDDEESAASVNQMLGNLRQLEDLVRESYTTLMIDAKAATFGQVLSMFADPAELPIVTHCTAGKDRTGVTFALLLMLLGVPDSTIIADYSLTNRYYGYLKDAMQPNLRKLAWFRVTLNDFLPALTAPPEVIRQTINHVRTQHGGIEAYLTGAGGLDAATLDQIRLNFLSEI